MLEGRCYITYRSGMGSANSYNTISSLANARSFRMNHFLDYYNLECSFSSSDGFTFQRIA